MTEKNEPRPGRAKRRRAKRSTKPASAPASTPAAETQKAAKDEQAEPSPEERARCARLRRARIGVDACPVSQIPLDVGASVPVHARATLVRGTWVSGGAAMLMRAELTAEQRQALGAWLLSEDAG